MASKTRDKLIDVAKQLFIRKGVENTTISDIANASDKGRRTIYTYFKDKKEIYRAVIERESDKMVAEIKAATEGCDTASDKLSAYIGARLSQAKNASSPYAAIKSLLSVEFGRTEKARKMASQKEEALLLDILSLGISTGEFDQQKAHLLKKCLYAAIRSIDLMLANEDETNPPIDFVPTLTDFLLLSLQSNR